MNVIVWVLLWAEIAQALGRSPLNGPAMALPGVNFVTLGRLAGWRGARLAAALALILASLPLAAGARAARREALAAAQVRSLGQGGARERERAVRELASLAADSQPAVLALAAQLEDPQLAPHAAAALARLGPRAALAAPALVAALAGASAEARGAAARALLAVSSRAAAQVPVDVGVPALLEAARGRGGERLPDVGIVWALAAGGDSAVPRLIEALQDADVGVRWHAAAALLHLGRPARRAAAALLRAMNDGEWVVRNAAGRALEDVAGPDTLPALILALRDPSAETRYHVARALGRIGSPAAGAVSALTAALRDEDAEVRMESAWALGVMGPAASEALPALGAALQDADPQVRSAAAWALGGVGAGSDTAVAALRRALGDEDREVRDAVASVLDSITRSAR